MLLNVLVYLKLAEYMLVCGDEEEADRFFDMAWDILLDLA